MKKLSLSIILALCCTEGQAFTLPKQAIKAYDCNHCTNLSHEKIHDKWPISHDLLKRKISNEQKSYGYKTQVSAEQLNKGVAISVRGPGAIVRVSSKKHQLMPQLDIKTPKNTLLSLKEASSLYSENEALAENLQGSKYQTIMQFKPELGSGTFILKSHGGEKEASNDYMISVYDKFSGVYLSLESNAVHYQYGDTLNATLYIKDNEINYLNSDVEMRLISPKGEQIPLSVHKVKRNTFKGTIELSSLENDRGENWYILGSAKAVVGEDYVYRSGSTAFSYSIPSATLINVKKVTSNPLTFVATIHVATASRYALQSVLYTKNENGQDEPIETSQKGEWFEPGIHLIQFSFDNSSKLSDDTLYLGYLRLIDYGQMKTVYQYNTPVKLTNLLG